MSDGGLTITPGGDEWKRLRKLATETIPGKRSALYFLNAKIRQLETVVPMSYRAHLALCLFAEDATGIPEIDEARIKLILVPRGVGKALALDTPVPTPTGWTTMGDLEEGDEVFARDGSVCRVKKAFDVLHDRTCYEVVFDTGDRVVADAEHIWTVQTTKSINRKNKRYVNMTTEEMKANLFYGPRNDRNIRVNVIDGVDYESDREALIMHPYVLGVWLGDGHSERAAVTTIDDEILDELEQLGYPSKRIGSGISYSLGRDAEEELKTLGVWGNKFIPEAYEFASEEDRLALLQGLLDTDGYASGHAGAFFYSTQEALARGVFRIAASLGLKPRISEKDAVLNGEVVGRRWDVYIRPDDRPLFRLTRKQVEIPERKSQRRRHENRMVVSVEEVPSVPVRCIAVDHPSQQFLVTEAYIPTHNSSMVTKGLPILRVLRNPEYATGIANETAALASTFLQDIKSEFESNVLLQTLFPEVIPDDFRATTWKSDRIITKRTKTNPTSPTLLATGVGGTVTGVHMDEWVCDDLLSQNAAEAAFRGNSAEIEATNRWITRLQPLLKSPKRDPIKFIGTRWWEGDSYEFVEDFWGGGEEKKEFLWTLKLPQQKLEWEGGVIDRAPETQTIKLWRRGEVAVFKFPAIDENGRPIFPERYDLHELQAMQEEDPVFYAGQYLLEPTAGAASTLDPSWLKTYEIDGSALVFDNSETGRKEYLPLRDLTVFISVDPAFSKKSSAARSAIPVVGTDGKRLFLLEDFAERLDSEDDIAAQVVAFYLRYRNYGCDVSRIFVETIVAQVAVANAIRRRFREEGLGDPPIEEIRSHGQKGKVMRIYGLEHYFKRGVFYYHKNMFKFFQEYVAFPRAILRDLLDAISFQRDEWERIFTMQHATGGRVTPEAVRARDASARERIRRAWGRRRR